MQKSGSEFGSKAGDRLEAARAEAAKYSAAASEQAARARAAMDKASAEARARAEAAFGNAAAAKNKSNTDSAAAAEGGPQEAAQSNFVKASKQADSSQAGADTDAAAAASQSARKLPGWLQSLADKTQGFREGLVEASYDLVGAKQAKKSTVVRKLRPLSKTEDASTSSDKQSNTAAETDSSSGEPASEGSESDSKPHRDEEVLPGLVEAPERTGALAIVDSAAEAWAAIQARLAQSVFIQVRCPLFRGACIHAWYRTGRLLIVLRCHLRHCLCCRTSWQAPRLSVDQLDWT